MPIKFIKFVIKACKKKPIRILVFTLSPTLMLAAYSKNAKNGQDEVKEFIVNRNWQYFYISPILAALVGFFNNQSWLLILGGLYAISRVNEIFYAFINDATSHLKKKKSEHSSSLKYYERIPLAMRSYIELIIQYGIVTFVLNILFHSMACGNATGTCELTMVQSLYYSGVTITTLGYGEITPSDVTSQFMSVYEVINGFSLIVVSFAIYVSKSISENEHNE